MRRLLLAAGLLAAFAAPARAGEPSVDVMAGTGLSGRIYFSQTEAETPFNGGRYRIGARVRTTRFGDVSPGMREEWSASLTRELFHVTIKGRLGTSPPGMQRASYHLAGGEAWFTFYGDTLGPEHPELAQTVWESSGPAPTPESLDRTWITRAGLVYSNINDHLEGTIALPALVENVWHFTFSETWRERSSFGLDTGFDRLNKLVPNGARETTKNNIDYFGNVLPITGWPNNWVGAKASQRLGPFKLTAAATRLNLLNNALQTMYSGEVAWTPAKSSWTLRAGYENKRARHNSTREGIWLGVARTW